MYVCIYINFFNLKRKINIWTKFSYKLVVVLGYNFTQYIFIKSEF